jgi:MoxR-like ATPase
MTLDIHFDPNEIESTRQTKEDWDRALTEPMDQRDGAVYVYNYEVRFAVRVALAASRPLLIRGEPGSGKSTLASSIARVLKWRYYDVVITSRTQARDLQYSYDAVRRLGDAEAATFERKKATQVGLHRYIEPGEMWWALEPSSAARRGLPDVLRLEFRGATDPGRHLQSDIPNNARAVVLLDEIDKADPDVPNDLLVLLGSLRFQVREIQRTIEGNRQQPPLIVITTNEERDLPPAFQRRCIEVTLALPKEETAFVDHMVKVASAHFGPRDGDQLYPELARRTFALRKAQQVRGLRQVSAAEYLDAVRSCLQLRVFPSADGEGDSLWRFIRAAVLKDSDLVSDGSR